MIVVQTRGRQVDANKQQVGTAAPPQKGHVLILRRHSFPSDGWQNLSQCKGPRCNRSSRARSFTRAQRAGIDQWYTYTLKLLIPHLAHAQMRY